MSPRSSDKCCHSTEQTTSRIPGAIYTEQMPCSGKLRCNSSRENTSKKRYYFSRKIKYLDLIIPTTIVIRNSNMAEAQVIRNRNCFSLSLKFIFLTNWKKIHTSYKYKWTKQMHININNYYTSSIIKDAFPNTVLSVFVKISFKVKN